MFKPRKRKRGVKHICSTDKEYKEVKNVKPKIKVSNG